jgi:nicotinic acid mononucleotide adenylyltransferase
MEIEDLLNLPVRCYVAASGAGSGIQEALWSVPGASKFLVGAQFPYSKEDMTRFLGFCPDKFLCEQTAMDMAIRSYLLADNGDPNIKPVGLGITASVASVREHRGDHKVMCAVITRGLVLSTEVTLPKEGAQRRYDDGRLADAVGISMLLAAAEGDLVKLQPFSDELNIGNAEHEALKALFVRPLFLRHGERSASPDGQSLTLFPGAFNPAHEGHFASARICEQECEDMPVTFQITVNQPHKDPLSVSDILDRLHWLQGKTDVLIMKDGALYIEKARNFPGSSFLIGSDALTRMLDPKWGIPVDTLLTEFSELGTEFKVSMRGKDQYKEILDKMDEEFWHMFQELSPNPYPDISSTQIRATRQGY